MILRAFLRFPYTHPYSFIFPILRKDLKTLLNKPEIGTKLFIMISYTLCNYYVKLFGVIIFCQKVTTNMAFLVFTSNIVTEPVSA